MKPCAIIRAARAAVASVCLIGLTACSGGDASERDRAEIRSVTDGPEDTGRDRVGTDAGASIAAEPVFPAKIHARQLDFTMLGPTDVVRLDDEQVYVLLESGRGSRTGRPMAIVDVDDGTVRQTAAAPVPLSRPYGVPTASGGLVVWNLSSVKHQPDLYYLETLHYDRDADLWRVVPPPESHMVQLADVWIDSDERAHLDIVDASGERGNYVLEPSTWSWKESESVEPGTCTTNHDVGPDGQGWYTGARFTDEIEPCAFTVVDGRVRELPTPPSPRCLHTVVRGPDAIWTVGGYESCGRSTRPTSDQVDRLVDGEDRWERLSSLPTAVFPSGAVPFAKTLFVFDQQMRIFAYDDRAKSWAIAEPVTGLENNSDWNVVSRDRVIALAWEKGTNRTVNKLVIYHFD